MAYSSFTITQPFLGAPLQFQPALGSPELDALIELYVPGPTAKQDKLSTVTIDFYLNASVDINTGSLTKTYDVYTSAWASESFETSPVESQSSGFSPAIYTPSPGSSATFGQDSGYGSLTMTPPTTTRTDRVAKKAKKEVKKVDEARLPGFSIMTKDGIDVTSTAGRGTKTKEQREHAHLMRIMKACDACKKKKVRCDPSHRRSHNDMSRSSTSTSKSSSSRLNASPTNSGPSLSRQTTQSSTPSFSPSMGIDDFILFPEGSDAWNPIDLPLEMQDISEFNFDVNDMAFSNYSPMNFSNDFTFSQTPSSLQYTNQSFTPQVSDQLEWADSLILQSPTQGNLQASQASPGSSGSQDYLLSPARPQPRSSPQESGQLDATYPSFDSYGQRATMGLNAVQQTSGSPLNSLTLSPDVSLEISLQSVDAYQGHMSNSSGKTNRKRSAPHDETEFSTVRSQSIADQPIILNTSIDVDAPDPGDSHQDGHMISFRLQQSLRDAGLDYTQRQHSRIASPLASQTSDGFLMSDCPELQISQEDSIPDYARDLTTASSRSAGALGLGNYPSGANFQRSSEQQQHSIAQAVENAGSGSSSGPSHLPDYFGQAIENANGGGSAGSSHLPELSSQASVNASPSLQSSSSAQRPELLECQLPPSQVQLGTSRFGQRRGEHLQTKSDLQEGAATTTQSGAEAIDVSRSPTIVYSIAMIACVTAFLASPLSQLQESSAQWLARASPFVAITALLFCATLVAQLPSVLTQVVNFHMADHQDVGSWVALAVLGWLTGQSHDSQWKVNGSGVSFSGKAGDVDPAKELFGDGFLDCMFEMSPVTVLGMV